MLGLDQAKRGAIAHHEFVYPQPCEEQRSEHSCFRFEYSGRGGSILKDRLRIPPQGMLMWVSQTSFWVRWICNNLRGRRSKIYDGNLTIFVISKCKWYTVSRTFTKNVLMKFRRGGFWSVQGLVQWTWTKLFSNCYLK